MHAFHSFIVFSRLNQQARLKFPKKKKKKDMHIDKIFNNSRLNKSIIDDSAHQCSRSTRRINVSRELY